MPDTPPHFPSDEDHIACPYCTIQIPADMDVCPHCEQELPPVERPKRAPVPDAAKAATAVLWERHGRWVKTAVPVLLGLIALFVVYEKWIVYHVKVVKNPSLPVQVEDDREGDAVVLRGTVTNRGDDIPDLSLQSVGIIVEFVYRDGHRERKTVFPKAEFRGEGALLKGETGMFEVEAPARGLTEVVLWSEIVDLGMGRKLIPPRRR